MKALSDEELAEISQAGNPEATATLIERYGTMLGSIARQCARRGRADDWHDLVQEARLAALAAIRSYDSTRGPLRAHVHVSAYRAVVTVIRRESRDLQAEPLDDEYPVDFIPDEAEENTWRDEVGDQVRNALAGLPPVVRRVLELRYGMGCAAMTIAEVATELKISPRSVTQAQRTGLELLRNPVKNPALWRAVRER